MIETIVIAAAGKGERMEHLSKEQPKHLVKVAGKPFLHYVLQQADRVGCKKMVVVVGYMADMVREFLAEQPYDIVVVDQNEVLGDKYGTAAVIEAVEQEVGDQPFVVQNGDSLYSKSVFESVMVDDGMNRVVGTHHPDPQHYGVIEAGTDGLLVRIVEKPKEPMCNVINLGIYLFQPEIFSAVKQVEKSPRGEYEVIDAINTLADEKKVKVEQLIGEWVDLGTPEDIHTVEKFLVKHHYI